MEHLKIYPVESGPVATFGYLIADTAQHVAVVIDVPMQSADIFLSAAQESKSIIKEIWLTHSHWDHTGDAAKLQRATGAGILVHAADEYRMTEPNAYTSFPLPFTLEAVRADRYFEHGQHITCGEWSFEVRHTPGHTEGGVCFIDQQHGVAFVGDTLFAGSIGRTDLPGGDLPTLLHSIRTQLFTLPDEIVIFPGHGSHSTIGTERRTNPFLQ
jgi:glyoxylase-like metal-dependent hydrolase (beta-lactamase superfamily II)